MDTHTPEGVEEIIDKILLACNLPLSYDRRNGVPEMRAPLRNILISHSTALLDAIEGEIRTIHKEKHDAIPSAKIYEDGRVLTLNDCSSMEAECYNAAITDVRSIIRSKREGK